MTRFILILLCCGFFTTPVQAQESTLDEVATMSLIRQLNSREADTRNAAEEKLRDAGPGVLDFLPAIDDRTSGELKERLLRIRDHLEKERVANTSKPSRLTLKGAMTLSDALKSIEQQTGNQIIDFRRKLGQQADDSKLDLDINDEPFWAAFDQLADAAGVTVYPYVNEARKLAIVAASETADPRAGRGVHQGLFRIEPTTLFSQRDLRDSGGDILRITLEVLWEPRVLPILIRQDLQEIEVVTDTGVSVSVQQTGTAQIPVRLGVASLDLQLPLGLPSRDAKTIKSLKGKFVALVPGGNVTFEFDDLVNWRDKKQSRGGLTVTLDDLRQNGGLQQISIRVRFDEAEEPLESHLDWVENNVVQLVDSNGKPADEPNYERYLERKTEIGFRYLFPVEGKLDGWKLVYTTPSGVAQIPVPYEIHDITLP